MKVVTFTLPAGVTATVYPVAVGKFERVLGFLLGSDGEKRVGLDGACEMWRWAINKRGGNKTFGGLVDAMTLGGLCNW